jgi:hypothetical protein
MGTLPTLDAHDHVSLDRRSNLLAGNSHHCLPAMDVISLFISITAGAVNGVNGNLSIVVHTEATQAASCNALINR